MGGEHQLKAQKIFLMKSYEKISPVLKKREVYQEVKKYTKHQIDKTKKELPSTHNHQIVKVERKDIKILQEKKTKSLLKTSPLE